MNRKLIALTFDDGPSNITEQVLDILEQEGIVGTFYLIGQQLTEEKKPILERQLALGCELANHSFTHGDMSKMDEGTIAEEIQKTSELIRGLVNVEPKFFRPPYISLSDIMYDTISMPFICGRDSRDWDPQTTAEDRVHNVLSQSCDGAIILMHDMENNMETLKALPVIIRELKKEGYEFTTTSGLFEEKAVEPMVHHKIWSCVFE